MWCATGNPNDTCHTCAKGFLESNFIQAVINKMSITTQLLYLHHSWMTNGCGMKRVNAPYVKAPYSTV